MTDRNKKGQFSGPNETSFKEGNKTPSQFKEGNKQSLKHGGNAYLQTGEVPDLPWKTEIEGELDSLRAGLVADLGGQAMMTEGQSLLIDQVIQLSGYTRLIDFWIRENGGPFVKAEGGDLKVKSALSAFYLACHNSIRLTLTLLKLHEPRSFERATPFEQYLNENEVKHETEKD
ncbi:MAG: hypothetical protein JW984_16170 [Deltaproteobacteria bacterium]|uniref:Uncharacterized protein n=1 Tax=Candidatus Zymogenus saltonus TaxID=2844893 RepID=A0A9D8KI74_9DELT|nr:hypothetical protein [Candidatus Zymogenus saltonus]